jgi:membrane protein YqaA with SNARE-associated domain
MHHLAALLHRLVQIVQPLAERLGAPGLALVAFFDSSFLSLPEVADALIVIMVIQRPAEWLYIAAMATVGSVAGCYALYLVGRAGGEAIVRKRFSERRVTRALALFERHGLLAIVVPAIMPPPMPFKIFVLLAGVARVRRRTFFTAAAIGRGFRYLGEAWLAYEYGDQATAFIHDNLPIVSLVAALVVAGMGTAMILWQRRRTA